MICHDHEQRGCGSADMDVWQSSDPLDPIKPMDIEVVLIQQLTCYCLTDYTQPLAMSLINSHTFECSMGHQISWEDACFHLHTSDRQHYPSNQQVRSCPDLDLTNLTVVLVVGRLGDDARQLVSPLGGWGNTRQPALAPSPSDGSCSRIALWLRAGS